MNAWYNEKALLLIENYLYHLKRPRIKWKKERFILSSYSIWATEELLLYIKNHDYNPIMDNVNRFIKIMDEYACLNISTSYIFSVASDTAKDILDMLLTNL